MIQGDLEQRDRQDRRKVYDGTRRIGDRHPHDVICLVGGQVSRLMNDDSFESVSLPHRDGDGRPTGIQAVDAMESSSRLMRHDPRQGPDGRSEQRVLLVENSWQDVDPMPGDLEPAIGYPAVKCG